MTADNFDMEVKSTTVDISVQDGMLKAEAEIYIEDFADALLSSNDNLDMLNDFVKKELRRRAMNAWDDGVISEDEYNIFKSVMEVIL